MDTVGVGLVGGPVPNEGGDLDEGGLVGHLLGLLNGITDGVQVSVAVLHGGMGYNDCTIEPTLSSTVAMALVGH